MANLRMTQINTYLKILLNFIILDSARNTIEEFSDDGSILYTFEIEEEGVKGEEDGETIIPDVSTVTMQASAVGYEPESKTTRFDLVEQDENLENNNSDTLDNEDFLPVIAATRNYSSKYIQVALSVLAIN